MARLFVAAWPDEAVLRALTELPQPEVPGVRWLPPENLHVTLRFLGAVADDEVPEIVGALSAIRAAPVEARLTGRPERLGRDALVVPVAGLDPVAHAVAGALPRWGDPRPFHGHLTLARLKGRPGHGIFEAPVGLAWPVGAVDLVESHLSPRGARYTSVATVPLSA